MPLSPALNIYDEGTLQGTVNELDFVGTNLAATVSGSRGTVTSNGAAYSWTARSAAEANSWEAIAYGDGLFVAVASSGTNRVMTSPDGVTWTARSAAEANRWLSVTFGNGLFVAVSDNGTNRVMTSPDGITWTARSAAEANQWNGVTFGNGLFVAVSGDGTNRAMTSPDGITWTARSAVSSAWAGVTYGDGLFVAVSGAASGVAMTSPDGITWTSRTLSEAHEWNAVTYGNGIYVAVSTLGTNRVTTSPDGITWTTRTASSYGWDSITYGNGLFVVMDSGGSGRSIVSSDGISWTENTLPEANAWTGVAYGNGEFISVASGGTNRVLTSGIKLEHTLYVDKCSGIGPILRQTSPTLITPTLGVASATSLACGTYTTSSGGMTFTPAAGSGFAIALSGAGDFVVNASQIYVDTSAACVGFGTSSPDSTVHILESGASAGSALRLHGDGWNNIENPLGVGFGWNFHHNGTNRVARATDEGGEIFFDASGDIVVRTFPSTSAGSTVTLTERFRVANAGAVSFGGTLACGAVSSTGAVKSSSISGGVGYATGAGLTVTQTTSRTTGVTINRVCGQITTDTTSLAAGATAKFTVTNSQVAATDGILLSIQSGTTTDSTRVRVQSVAAGSFTIVVENGHASTAETGAIVINFQVVKGVTS